MSIETIGMIASLTAMLLFLSPIAQIRSIIRNKDSKEISPLIYMAMAVNGLFWTAYGLGVHNIYIITPNMLGIVFGILTITIIHKYR